jgi:hypothetical protein
LVISRSLIAGLVAVVVAGMAAGLVAGVVANGAGALVAGGPAAGVVDKRAILACRPPRAAAYAPAVGAGPGIELLLVAGQPLWPADGGGGGQERTAGMVVALTTRFSVRVLAPVEGQPPKDVVIGVDPLPDEEPARRLVAALSPQSRRGRAELGPLRARALLQAVADHRPRAVLFAGSHLASAAPTIDRPIFVDFPRVEARSGTGGLEAWKARWWEPVEARRAAAVAAATEEDLALLVSWGATAVLVPDGTSPSTWLLAVAPLAEAVEQAVRA